MPQYRVTKQSFFESRMIQPGAVVEFDGIPGDNLEPLDSDGEARKKERLDSLRPVDANEAIGRGMAKGMAAAQKKGADEDEDHRDARVSVVSVTGDASLTTIGHSSMSQKSVGGNDAEHLYESDGKGGLVPQNPRDDKVPDQKADSPDDGHPKVDKDGNAAVTVGGESNAVEGRASAKPAVRAPAAPAAKTPAKRK